MSTDLLVYLDVEVESLPESVYKIYEEGYDKTIAGLQAVLTPSAGGQTESSARQESYSIPDFLRQFPNQPTVEDLSADPALIGLELAAGICRAEGAKWESDGVPEPMSRLCIIAIGAEITRRMK